MSPWVNINDRLPGNNQRVLAFIPKNKVFLPGMQLDFEIREVIVLHFRENFYAENADKKEKYGAHFWSGEGNSNHFFQDVTHWKTIPDGPQKT